MREVGSSSAVTTIQLNAFFLHFVEATKAEKGNEM